MKSILESIESPAYVSEDEARTYREKHDYDVFVGSGWYIQAELKIIEGKIGEHDVGAIVAHYYGPYDTEGQALAEIPNLVPGIFVILD